jgi:hypothetical protein
MPRASYGVRGRVERDRGSDRRKDLEELMPFEARVEQYRAGVAEAPGDARAWVAEQSGEIVGVAVCRREGTAVELRDPGRSAGCGVVAVAESRRAEASPI